MPAIVSLFLQRHDLLLTQRRSEVVDFILQDVPMRPIDTRVANLQARAMARV